MGSVSFIDVQVDDLALNLENPRHDKVGSRDEAMVALLNNEGVIAIAEDIAERGSLNPLERLGVEHRPDLGGVYVALEGNRRVAALQLLKDPNSIPATGVNNRANVLRRLTKAAENNVVNTVSAVQFEDPSDAEGWIDLLHMPQSKSPATRKPWDSRQQARRGGTGNENSLALIDLVTDLKLATKNQMAGKLTTINRLITNKSRARRLGLAVVGGEFKRTLPWKMFAIALDRIVSDLLSGELSSRSTNRVVEIDSYLDMLVREMGSPLENDRIPAQRLKPSRSELDEQKNSEDTSPGGEDGSATGTDPGQSEQQSGGGGEDELGGSDQNAENGSSADRSEQQSGGGGEGEASGSNRNAENGSSTDEPEQPDDGGSDGSTSPSSRGNNGLNEDLPLEEALKQLKSEKFLYLFQSLKTVSFQQHPLLAVVGCQSLIDGLAAGAGSRQGKLKNHIMGLPCVIALGLSQKAGSVSTLIEGIDTYANLTKHDTVGNFVNGAQLVQNMRFLSPVLVAIADEVSKSEQQSE